MFRLLVAILIAPSLFGQKTSTLSWNAKEIQSVQTVLPFASRVNIIAENRSTIKIEYQTEGEYQNELLLSSSIVNHELYVEEQLAPSFDPYHDKLSAHKVMASTLTLWLPENTILSLQIENAKNTLSGKFQSLFLRQNEGNILLKQVDAKGEILTQKASIELIESEEKVFAFSKNGMLKGAFSKKEEASLILQSREGNISFISNRK